MKIRMLDEGVPDEMELPEEDMGEDEAPEDEFKYAGMRWPHALIQ